VKRGVWNVAAVLKDEKESSFLPGGSGTSRNPFSAAEGVEDRVLPKAITYEIIRRSVNLIEFAFKIGEFADHLDYQRCI
jgi:hypothetical protein